MGQKGILLRLVKAMDFIDKQDGLFPVILPLHPRLIHNRTDFLDTGKNSRKTGEMRLNCSGNNPGQGRLAGSRRSPENHGEELVCLDGAAQKRSCTHQVGLPHIFIKRSGSHPVCQGTRILTGFHIIFFKKIHYRSPLISLLFKLFPEPSPWLAQSDPLMSPSYLSGRSR